MTEPNPLHDAAVDLVRASLGRIPPTDARSALAEVRAAYNDAVPHGQYETFDSYRFSRALLEIEKRYGVER